MKFVVKLSLSVVLFHNFECSSQNIYIYYKTSEACIARPLKQFYCNRGFLCGIYPDSLHVTSSIYLILFLLIMLYFMLALVTSVNLR